MPWTKVDITGQPYENVDEVELDAKLMATVVDGIVNEMDHVVKRPGLTEFSDLGTNAGVDGLYWWDKQATVVAVSNGQVFKITDSVGTTTEITGSTALGTSGRATFAPDEDSTNLAIANGAQIVHTDLSTLTTLADADAPILVSHVGFLDGYVLCNQLTTGRIWYFDLNAFPAMTANAFFTAESNPDDVQAFAVGFREIIILGSESVEFWINDGVTPFSRLQGSSQPFGTSARYSLAQVGNSWVWLDQERRLVTMEGRKVVPVSNPYERVIQGYSNVDDAEAYVMSVAGYPLYVINFPAGKETLIYNYISRKWSKWGRWDTTLADYRVFRGKTYCFARQWNKHLVGDTTNGKIYTASRSVFQDDGNIIRTLVRTGVMSHGTETDKFSHELRIRTKRGLANATVSNPQLSIKVRRNNRAQWGNERWFSLGQVGEHEPHIRMTRNGTYRTVQYELVHTDASDLILVGAEENITATGE